MIARCIRIGVANGLYGMGKNYYRVKFPIDFSSGSRLASLTHFMSRTGQNVGSEGDGTVCSLGGGRYVSNYIWIR